MLSCLATAQTLFRHCSDTAQTLLRPGFQSLVVDGPLTWGISQLQARRCRRTQHQVRTHRFGIQPCSDSHFECPSERVAVHAHNLFACTCRLGHVPTARTWRTVWRPDWMLFCRVDRSVSELARPGIVRSRMSAKQTYGIASRRSPLARQHQQYRHVSLPLASRSVGYC